MHCLDCRTEREAWKIKLCRPDRPSCISTLLPERDCPQPQHVRKGLNLGALGQRCVAAAAAAEDSHAPAMSRRLAWMALSRCARPLAETEAGAPFSSAASFGQFRFVASAGVSGGSGRGGGGGGGLVGKGGGT